MTAELFKTDRNVKILIVSDKGNYKNIFCYNSELFKSDIEFVADFECEKWNEKDGAKNEIEDLLELLKPDVLLSEKKTNLHIKALKSTEMLNKNIDIQYINNNGSLVLWYTDINEKKLKSYLTLSLLINHPYEIKNKLGID